MFSFIDTPNDHRSLIYSFLDIKSLISLGITSKTNYHDNMRISKLVQVVVDSYFYIQKDYMGCIKRWSKFPYHDLFYQYYLERLQKISFDDVQIIFSKSESISNNSTKYSNTNIVEAIIVHNQMREIKCGQHFDRIITFFNDHILKLEIHKKHKILENVFKYFYRLLSLPNTILEKNLKSLFLGIHNTLALIFVESNNVTRKFMIDELDKIQRQNSLSNEKFRTQYKIKNFLHQLPLTYSDITRVIEIGDLLMEMDKRDDLKYFLQEYFEDFLDTTLITSNNNNLVVYLDDYAEEIYHQLKIKYHPFTNTYGMKLSQQMDTFNTEMYDSLMKAITFRIGPAPVTMI